MNEGFKLGASPHCAWVAENSDRLCVMAEDIHDDTREHIPRVGRPVRIHIVSRKEEQALRVGHDREFVGHERRSTFGGGSIAGRRWPRTPRSRCGVAHAIPGRIGRAMPLRSSRTR